MNGSFKQQNEVWSGMNSGVDLNSRIPQIVSEISTESDFIPNQILSTSSWWNKSTGVGAFHFSGKFKGKSAVLKVQGVRPTTSEIYMINSYDKQNKSKIVRPPKIYDSFPWDDAKGYEAFILEDVGSKLVIDVPTNLSQVETFFEIYNEYRLNCINVPWVEKPNADLTSIIKTRFNEWIKASQKIFTNHPFRKDDDENLILKGVEILIKNKNWLIPEFVHGHFSARDLFKVDDQIVLLSNLYWSWRAPYYDLIFAYHWFIYELANNKDITTDFIEAQRKLWLDKIESIAIDKTLLKYALLERALAGLTMDALSIDTTKPISKYLVDKTREIVKELIEELS